MSTVKLYKQLINKIEGKKSVIGILGLGYVGLPLAVAFAKNGYRVIGFDKSSSKVKLIKQGKNYIADIAAADFKKAVGSKRLNATDNFRQIARCDVLIICVPTPLDRFKKPDMSYIDDAARQIGRYMKPGVLISLESTTYPTTTEKMMLPILEKGSGFKVNRDFWVCFSPERIDPGNKKYKVENTPKVIGGLGRQASQLARAVYSKAITTLYAVSSPRTAEMVKILENTYRFVNICLINELALLAGKMGISIWEVIEAAKTKPYGFQAFYPGAGVGGHCIPLDPFYLEYIAKQYNFDLTMINTAGQIDNLMPHRMVIKIQSALNRHKKSINGSRILFLGVTYKANIDDTRESPVLRIIDEVSRKGGRIEFHDPFIKEIRTTTGKRFKGQRLTPRLLRTADCVVIPVKHDSFDPEFISQNAKLIVDLKNVIPGADRKVITKL
jgi:UDP-N-acetyl-D-glucosamine dehydrogenase